METYQDVQKTALTDVQNAQDFQRLDEVRISFLGKNGIVSQALKSLASLNPELRKQQGSILNSVRDAIQKAVEEKRCLLQEQALIAALESEKVDITLPASPVRDGYVHPLSQAWYEAIQILAEMGFKVVEGPDIEDDYHNFTALNIPFEHPARQEQDTFYLKGKDQNGNRLVLRTHTSPVQIRVMETEKPPLHVVVPGRVYRSDYDQTHTPTFHQIEGFFIDKNVTMAHLKGCLSEFCRRFFGLEELPLRFRPGYFPFTEPSAEVDIACSRSGGELQIGGGDDWLEILGCGMIHPNVLKNGGIDPQEYQGFAFGMGVERIAMLKYGIPDLRSFYEGDMRWLKHYGFRLSGALVGGRVG